MDKLEQKQQKLARALATLEKAIDTFGRSVREGKSYNPHLDYEEERRSYRDSLVQRFEYSVDIFWKFLRKYLESKNILPDIKIPGEVVRACHAVGALGEEESDTILLMIKERNKTSHLYLEEIAEQLAQKIPGYYAIMADVMQRLAPQS